MRSLQHAIRDELPQIGCMLHVPIDAGTEAVAVVRKYFTAALRRMPQ